MTDLISLANIMGHGIYSQRTGAGYEGSLRRNWVRSGQTESREVSLEHLGSPETPCPYMGICLDTDIDQT